MLSDDLSEYAEQSAPILETEFDDMMKSLGIQIKPANIQPSVDVNKFLTAKKCGNVCKNDSLLDDLDKFFNSMKVKPKSIPPSANQQSNVHRDAILKPNNSNITNSNPVKISIDQSNGDLVFETSFRRKKIHDQNVAHQTSLPNVKDNNRTELQKQSVFPDRSRDNNFPPNGQNVFLKPTNIFSAAKRKSNEVGNNFVKRPNYVAQPETSAPNPFQMKNDFKSASEELADQYSKKYGTNPQNDNNPAYNVHPNGGGLRKSLGGRRTINNKFVPPFANHEENAQSGSNAASSSESVAIHGMDMSHPRLKNVDEKMIEIISNEIMERCDRVGE